MKRLAPATSDSPVGPFEVQGEGMLAPPTRPLSPTTVRCTRVIIGPEGDTYLAFHGWDEAFTFRGMFVEPLTWNGVEPQFAPDY